jgi:hypothetical protein
MFDTLVFRCNFGAPYRHEERKVNDLRDVKFIVVELVRFNFHLFGYFSSKTTDGYFYFIFFKCTQFPHKLSYLLCIPSSIELCTSIERVDIQCFSTDEN